MSDCLFCKMVAGEIKPDVVYEDDKVLAFRDLHPQAPLHVLVIPKRHIANLNDLDDAELGGHLLQTAAKIAKDLGYADSGYRTVLNCNADGGQTVFHLHLHLLAGRAMHWPPG
ncbi:histidine triad nucleotide-binding protein [Methylomonas sp. MED-D]|uniref:Histidine triad nucleotide-binding protein n=1 Tax=Methylomonas koyamae TaxID=702114 RepID=A0A177NAL4_9GAMM|nr:MULTISPECIES: histidine triad nucleotide-binding protein [Methylomonas]MDT4332064.1 histidine triad nucleotide-binding protein [Methylomonas sp. MV1]NJA04381.1 histidine triad nucleotide-binding protein [Methylococcaceae bacterium WWC4]OAI15096.1 histidine triad nucleotide-binding protein [Methylomonas koyamae]WGS85769.1 histidine triad nucleotide-binding protein [Methylomonas sp. UP202]